MDGMERMAVICIVGELALVGWGGIKLYQHFNPAAAPTPQQIMRMRDSPERDAAADNILRSNGVPAGQEPLVREVILHEGGNCALLSDPLVPACETSKRTFGIK